MTCRQLASKAIGLLEEWASYALTILFLVVLGALGYLIGAWASVTVALLLDAWNAARVIRRSPQKAPDSPTPFVSIPFYIAAGARLPISWPLRVAALAVLFAVRWLVVLYVGRFPAARTSAEGHEADDVTDDQSADQ